MSEQKSTKPTFSNFLKRDQLKYGEAYRTTKPFTWSNYDQKMEKIYVPADELLIYRISKLTRSGNENVLFVWLDKNITICLSTTEKSILFVKHMEWDERHRSLNVTEREDDTQEIETPPKETDGDDQQVSGRESVDS